MALPSPESSVASELGLRLLQLVRGGEVRGTTRQVLRDFSHRCRNLLNSIRMGLYLAKRGATQPLPAQWLHVERTYLRIESLLDRVQTIYRGCTPTLVRAPLGSLIHERHSTWSEWIQRGGGQFSIEYPSEEFAGDYDPMYLGSALDALVQWRSSILTSETRACLRWRTTERSFELEWLELTSSVPTSSVPSRPSSRPSPEIDPAFESLALPLLARAVMDHGGELICPDRFAGFTLQLRWPLQRESPAPGQRVEAVRASLSVHHL
jgi:hypothetical protein